jgi:hypothetical protein
MTYAAVPTGQNWIPVARPDSNNFKGKWTASIDKDSLYFKIQNGSGNVQSNYLFLLKEFSSHPLKSKAFKVVRDAGTMYFEGNFKANTGEGSLLFSPDPNFNTSLMAIGFPRFEEPELLVLYLADMTSERARELRRSGYALSKNQLLALASFKVDPDYIQSWSKYGYPKLSYDEVIGLRAVGVSQAYANTFSALGYKELSANYLIKLKSMGISTDYVKTFHAVGFKSIPLGELIEAKSLGLTPGDVSKMQKDGHGYTSLAQYCQLKVQGMVSKKGTGSSSQTEKKGPNKSTINSANH